MANYSKLPFVIPLTENTWDITPWKTTQYIDLEDDPYDGFLVTLNPNHLRNIIDSTKGHLYSMLLSEIIKPGTILLQGDYLSRMIQCQWNVLVYCLLQYTYFVTYTFDIHDYFLSVHSQVRYLLSQIKESDQILILDEAPIVWDYFKTKLDYFMDKYDYLLLNYREKDQ